MHPCEWFCSNGRSGVLFAVQLYVILHFAFNRIVRYFHLALKRIFSTSYGKQQASNYLQPIHEQIDPSNISSTSGMTSAMGHIYSTTWSVISIKDNKRETNWMT